MTTTKNVSRDGYAWGHFGVILFHTIIATFLIFNDNPGFKNIFKFLRKESSLRRTFFWIGIVLLIFSLLSLWPIFMHYNKDYEYVIDMNN
jgi:uncharacterized membrane protein YhaH (DUF805 family)